jgi:hypothetical protein
MIDARLVDKIGHSLLCFDRAFQYSKDNVVHKYINNQPTTGDPM